VGSEGRGLGSAIRRRCDLVVRIPMHGRIASLNAAVAGSILVFEAAAQRHQAGLAGRSSVAGEPDSGVERGEVGAEAQASGA
jgi:tRNA C32,U32 (ribose-2'-O)-methylase TrmJ